MTASTKVCNATKGCVQCNAAGDCAGAGCTGTVFNPAQTCNPSNACVAGAMTDCSTTATKACNAAKGCVQCNVAGDCAAAGCTGTVFNAAQTCNPSNACVAGAMTDCMTIGQVCNATVGCVQCNVGGDCAAAMCNGTVFTAAQTCSGANVCLPGAQVDCSVNATNTACIAAVGCGCNSGGDCSSNNCNTATHVRN